MALEVDRVLQKILVRAASVLAIAAGRPKVSIRSSQEIVNIKTVIQVNMTINDCTA